MKHANLCIGNVVRVPLHAKPSVAVWSLLRENGPVFSDHSSKQNRSWWINIHTGVTSQIQCIPSFLSALSLSANPQVYEYTTTHVYSELKLHFFQNLTLFCRGLIPSFVFFSKFSKKNKGMHVSSGIDCEVHLEMMGGGGTAYTNLIGGDNRSYDATLRKNTFELFTEATSGQLVNIASVQSTNAGTSYHSYSATLPNRNEPNVW